ncbi:uncharacterized protein METZ01_LOCUS276516 [marine metagenome]|uniref:Uncharacterized protein n=1 Tax=marine metagenome TaxID=408172 RepID=A0A382KJY3_9ZZZZ
MGFNCIIIYLYNIDYIVIMIHIIDNNPL